MKYILCIFALWIDWFGHQSIRGKSVAPSIIQMTDTTKKTDNMTKMKPLAQLLKEFKETHGDRYGYSKIDETNYHGWKSKVPIICPEHGVFYQRVAHHLEGHGCKKCASSRPHTWKREKNSVGGVLDIDVSTGASRSLGKIYTAWMSMLRRCNSIEYKGNIKTYNDCVVCEEWLLFSNFLKWYKDNSNESEICYQVDKDILFHNNKLYSPETCCLVPQEINKLVILHKTKKSDNPIGVYNGKGGKFFSSISIGGNIVHLGTFNTKESAFAAYKTAKEKHIQEVATEYFNEGKITERVYNALMNYKVEITD